MVDAIETTGQPSAVEIEAALGRILDREDATLGNRSREFLRFIVAETLAGRSKRLKAFTIALAVFGRDASFDPQTNSIVRVEATRLRRWLERYYAEAGAAEEIEIRLPRGGYAPEFVRRNPRRAGEPQPAPVANLITEPDQEPPTGAPRLHWRPWTAGLAGLVLILAFGLLAWSSATRWTHFANLDTTPVGAIRASGTAPGRASHLLRAGVRVVFKANGEDAELAADLKFALEAALGRFDDLAIVGGPSSPDGEDGDYRLEGRSIAIGSGARRSLVFRLTEARSSMVIWSKSLDASAPGAQEWGPLAGALVRPLAQRFGVIFGDLRRRAGAGALPADLECFVNAVEAEHAVGARGTMAARACLEEALRAEPGSSLALSELADLDLLDYLRGMPPRGGGAALRDARQSADQALWLAPESARANMAAFDLAFYEGRFDEAFRMGQRALAYNPEDTDIAARLGAGYARRGDFDRGMMLLRQAREANVAYPGWTRFYDFLEAHLAGRSEEARQSLEDCDPAAFPLCLAARIIVDHEAGEGTRQARDIDEFSARFPNLAADPRGFFERLKFAPAIADRLASELKQAGLGERLAPGRGEL